MRRDRPRHQVVLQLMPGAEPWIRVEAAGGRVLKLPAAVSLLELWEVVQGAQRRPTKPDGEVLVRVPLGLVLESPTIGAYRRRGAHS